MSLKISSIVADIPDIQMMDVSPSKKRKASDVGLQDLSSSPTKKSRSPVKTVRSAPITPEKLERLLLDFQASLLESPIKNTSGPNYQLVRRSHFPLAPDTPAASAQLVATAESEITRDISSVFDTFRFKRKLFKNVTGELAAELPLIKTPVPTGNETNGSWFIYKGQDIVGVYKPRLQARGAVDGPRGKQLRKGIPLGQEALREKLADTVNKTLRPLLCQYTKLSDFGVPQTTVESFKHILFGPNHDVGSFQRFEKDVRAITIDDVDICEDQHIKAAIFDLIALNTDRHFGNLLYSEEKEELVLIDHGGCLPESKGLKELQFEWMNLPFAKKTLPSRWQMFLLDIDTKKLVNELLRVSMKLDAKLPNNQMAISTDALLVMAHAVKLLKMWVHERPELSICDFARGYVKESVPMATVSYANGDSRNFVLDSCTMRSNFDRGAFCEEQGITEDVDVYFNRKSVGEQYIAAIQKNCKILSAMKFESALDAVDVGLDARLFKTTHELINL
jgi:hypothetical protein